MTHKPLDTLYFPKVGAPALALSQASPQDYLSLLKPRVMSLVIFTAAVAILIAPSNLHPFLKVLSLLCIAMGSGAAGCLNMWYERRLDKMMQRTAKRALPRNIISPSNALALGIITTSFSIILLEMASNIVAALLLAFTIFFYVVVYTVFLKPRTAQNIVIGGVAGALPPVVAWQAVDPGWHALPWIMFSIIFLWTPAHFWSLGLVQTDDYKRAGIPILPNVRGEKYTKQHIVLYTVLTVLASFLPIYLTLLGKIYTISAVTLGFGFVYVSWRLMIGQLASLKFFAYSIIYLFILFLSMGLDRLFM